MLHMKDFSRAHMRYIFNAGELLFYRLTSLHNVAFYLRLMQGGRDALEQGTFVAYREAQLAAFAAGPAA